MSLSMCLCLCALVMRIQLIDKLEDLQTRWLNCNTQVREAELKRQRQSQSAPEMQDVKGRSQQQIEYEQNERIASRQRDQVLKETLVDEEKKLQSHFYKLKAKHDETLTALSEYRLRSQVLRAEKAALEADFQRQKEIDAEKSRLTGQANEAKK